jgi:DeoR/GlpR family transcriptional regulator of sugar metabolism
MEYLRDLLRKHHQSIQSLQGDQVELICHQEALSKIQAEAPTSKIKWALNGVTIIPDGMTVIIKNNSNLGNALMLSVICTCIIHSRNVIFMQISEKMCTIIDLTVVTPQSHFTVTKEE